MLYKSTKIIELGSCAFRQWRADSHCKFIHGYRLIGKFWFACNELDNKNWVVDFGGLQELKKELEHQFDHTLCIASDDPLLSSFRELHRVGAVDLRIMVGGVGIERTAEWCFKTADRHIREMTNNRCWVEKVEVWEHEKNSAIVSSGYHHISDHNPYVSDKHITTNNTAVALVEPVSIANTVAAPSTEIEAAINNQKDNTPLKKDLNSAPIGNKVTSGWSNPFAGTSWGN
jgi:6-pyruvoyltetrahydropterin/6-carboxytetrahydropterin synthase